MRIGKEDVPLIKLVRKVVAAGVAASAMTTVVLARAAMALKEYDERTAAGDDPMVVGRDLSEEVMADLQQHRQPRRVSDDETAHAVNRRYTPEEIHQKWGDKPPWRT